MTNDTDTSPEAVERFKIIGGGNSPMNITKDPRGGLVRYFDYHALAARLADVEAERDRIRNTEDFWEECAVLNEKRWEEAEAKLAKAREDALREAARVANSYLVKSFFGSGRITKVEYSDFIGAAILALIDADTPDPKVIYVATPKPWEFDDPYKLINRSPWFELYHSDWLIASFHVSNFGSEHGCVEAAWRFAYERNNYTPETSVGEAQQALNFAAAEIVAYGANIARLRKLEDAWEALRALTGEGE